MARFAIPLLVFGVLVVLFGVGLKLNPREVPSPFVGKPAPAFTLPRLDDPGSSVSEQDFRGQVSLLNVWASWCVACRQEHPLLNALAADLPIYGLNYKDTRDAALGWLSRFGNPYRLSAFDQTGRVGIDWGVYGVPETFVIDRQGVVRHKHIGPLTPQVIDETILPLVRRLRTEGGG